MPGFITHYICGEAIIKILPKNISGILEQYRQLYNVGSQGPDIFFYYLPGLIKKNIKNLGVDMHKTNFNLFISNMLNALSKADEKSSKIIFSYLCGYLTHYALDLNAHPYVYYKTGFQLKGEKNKRAKLRFSVNHRNFETAIDVIMLKMMSSEKPSDKKLWQMVKADGEEADFISEILSSSINSAYSRKISTKQVSSAMRYMVNLTRILQSKRGRRKRLMELVEDLTVKEHVASCMIHKQEIADDIDYLNILKKPWYKPWDRENQVTESFGDLFNCAVKSGAEFITDTYSFMQKNISKENLLKKIGNRSLSSGLDIDEDKEFIIHENLFA